MLVMAPYQCAIHNAAMIRFVLLAMTLSMLGCMRSGPINSQRPLCLDGEQIVMANTLFCVYVEPTTPVECGPEVPHRHQIEDTTICSFDPAPDPILLAAVVEATALPPLIDGLLGFVFGGDELDAGATSSDGLVTDAEPSDSEPPTTPIPAPIDE